MNDDSLISRREGWLAAGLGEEVMMMHFESDNYLHLAGVGGRIWELLETPQTIAFLCRSLAQESAIEPAVARSEVVEFLSQLQQQEAIDVTTATAA